MWSTRGMEGVGQGGGVVQWGWSEVERKGLVRRVEYRVGMMWLVDGGGGVIQAVF